MHNFDEIRQEVLDGRLWKQIASTLPLSKADYPRNIAGNHGADVGAVRLRDKTFENDLQSNAIDAGFKLSRYVRPCLRDSATLPKERRAFEVLLVSAPDRLGRNATLVSSLVRELEQTGIKTLFVANR